MSKSTITLLNGATIAPADMSLVQFCQDIVALNEAGTLATILRPVKPAQTSPTIRKPKTARTPQARKASATMRMTVSGREMPADPGTMSESQMTRIARKCEALGEPLTSDEIKAMSKWSMADASDYYASL